jgi:uncharacterized delta-60 repeat protein
MLFDGRAVFALSVLVLTGCATVTVSEDDGGVPDAGPTGFTIALSSDNLFVRQGETESLTVTVLRELGFTGSVTLAVTGLPAGINADPVVVAGSDATATLSFQAEIGAVQGSAEVSIDASGGEADRQQADLQLLVGGAPGTPDRSFAEDGSLNYTVPGQVYAGRGIVTQDDGLIVATGSTATQAITMRLLPDGRFDSSFATDGVAASGTGTFSQGIAVTQLDDGRIISAGVANGAADGYDFGIYAYSSSGVLDSTFGTDGIAVFNPGDPGFAELLTLAVADNGDLIVSGNDFGSGSARVLRFSSLGIRDNTFNVDEGGATVEAAVIQSDGKIVIGGSSGGDFWLARYNTDGSRDGGFGTGGAVTTDFQGAFDSVHGLALLPGGAILAVGLANDGVNDKVASARYTASGTLDGTYGTGGKAETAIVFKCRSPNAIAVDDENRIVFVGAVGILPSLVRLNPDGSPDSSFGTGGLASVDFEVTGSTLNTGAFGVAIDSDGRILFTGEVGPPGGQQIIVGRIWP